MRCKFNTKITDIKGTEIQGPDGSAIDLAWLAGECLLAIDQGASADEKLKRFALARKIHETPDCEFTVEELALLKNQIGKHHSPLLVGMAYSIIERGDAV
jgi:hypothetical protein